ncbi:MAG: lytic transglycosylase domain-containing protein [Cetobacterium sp.]|uniref:lytic transglycosylase domain-containing protein n=1 Tax=Cetobacterium sp. TaxID=2071632 RepID=UPI003F324D0C
MKKLYNKIVGIVVSNFSLVIQVLFVLMVIIFLFQTGSRALKSTKEIMERDLKILKLTNVLEAQETTLNELKTSSIKFEEELKRLELEKIELENKVIVLNKQLSEKKEIVLPKVVEAPIQNNYKEFEYAMKTSKLNSRYKLSEEDISLIVENSKKYKIDPHLAIGIIWYESRFNTNAKSKTSSASGYGQFIKSTGAWVHKDLLKRKDTYDHNVTPFQPKNSIPMMYAYLDYLIKRNKGDIRKVLVRYNGGELGDKYFNDIDKYFKTVTNGSIHLDVLENKLKKNYGYIL